MASTLDAAYGDDGRRLRDHAGRGAMWSIGVQWSIRLSGLITFVILGRLLAPEDFGAIALASTLVVILSSLSDFGFAAYLVQADDPGQRTFSTAFWFSATAGVVLAAVLVGAAWPLAMLLGAPGTGPVLAAVSLSVLLDSFKGVPTALLKRRFDFRSLAVRRLVGVVVGQVVAIALAVGGAGVWALVAQVWAVSIVSLVATWAAAHWRPSMQFSVTDARLIGGYGVHVLGSDLLWNGMQWITDGLVSRFLGLQQLGYLSMASRVVQMTVDVAAAAGQQVAVPLFASVKHQRQRLANAYLTGVAIVTTVLVPTLAGLAVNAHLLVPAVLGQRWEPAVPVFQLMALVGMARAVGALDLPVLLGVGRPRLLLAVRTVTAGAIVAVTAVTAHVSVYAVAAGFAAVSAVIAPVQLSLVSRVIGVRPATSLRRVLPPLLLTIVSSAPAVLWTATMTGRLPALVVAATSLLLLAAVHIALVWLLQRDVFRAIAGIVTSLLARLPRRGPSHR